MLTSKFLTMVMNFSFSLNFWKTFPWCSVIHMLFIRSYYLFVITAGTSSHIFHLINFFIKIFIFMIFTITDWVLDFFFFFFTSSMLSLVFLAITFSQLQAKKSVISKLLSLIVDLKKLWNKNQINTAHEKSNHFFYKKASLRKFREW